MSEYIGRAEIGQQGVVPCVLLQPVVAKGETLCSPGTIAPLDNGLHVWPMDKPCARCGAAL